MNTKDICHAILLEINFSKPGGDALPADHALWTVLCSMRVLSNSLYCVLIGETDMSHPSRVKKYHAFLKKISSEFPDAVIAYFGKQKNHLSLAEASVIGCNPVYQWQNRPGVDADTVNYSHKPFVWHCFSHRCVESEIVKKIVCKNILNSSTLVTWYAPDTVIKISKAITQNKAAQMIQSTWRSHKDSVSTAIYALYSIALMDEVIASGLGRLLSNNDFESTATTPHAPTQEKPSSLSPRSTTHKIFSARNRFTVGKSHLAEQQKSLEENPCQRFSNPITCQA